MNTYNPAYALLIFIAITSLVYLIFRPKKGWVWLIRNNLKLNERIVIEDVLKYLYHSENSSKEDNVNGLTSALKFNDRVIVDVVKKMYN